MSVGDDRDARQQERERGQDACSRILGGQVKGLSHDALQLGKGDQGARKRHRADQAAQDRE